ncbi:hypothetical protein EG328_009376 [Venturia inaequalis]|uniref:N-acetyltransferase domain-containing protein n=1 Tax=Venturia inaequalis TaxID=5025 RepID=A0A8H3UA12_VENIN|nr:hypothetical protein EG328_009376 [Venturia inaequalis]
MPLKFLPFTALDIPRGLEIHNRVLHSSQSPVTNLLFNPPATPESIERQVERFTLGPDTFLYKAVENDVTIGYISAKKVSKISDHSLLVQKGSPSWHESCGISRRTWDKCFEMRAEARKESFDFTVDHLHVHALATDPGYQRRGAGAALLEKIKAIADEKGLPMYLTSTETGRKLYERAGFQPMKEIVIDLEEMGEVKKGREMFTVSLASSPHTGEADKYSI